jgi:rhodanese-related sulfurtransferase
MRIKKSKYLITFVISVLMGLSVHTLAAEVASDAAIPSELTAKRLKKPDHSFLVSAESVLQKIKRKQKIILVDIRKPGEFERVSIPGSINIPLHFIKSKAFLKLKPLVLVNTGYPYSQMEKECKRLRNNGFKVSILTGGIISWYRKGGPLKGDLLAVNEYTKISSRIFFQEKDYSDRIVLDVSKEHTRASKKLIPYAIHMLFFNNLNFDDLRAAAVNKADITYFLIFNENGDHYEKIEKIMEKKGLENTFYLTGGLNAYKKYLQHLVLSRQPRDSRIKRVNKCSNCGPVKGTK